MKNKIEEIRNAKGIKQDELGKMLGVLRSAKKEFLSERFMEENAFLKRFIDGIIKIIRCT